MLSHFLPDCQVQHWKILGMEAGAGSFKYKNKLEFFNFILCKWSVAK